MKCEICNKNCNGLKGLSIHLKKKHNFNDNELKNYYDKYIKKENEGKCYFCNNDAIFFGFSKGYHRICNSKKCLGKTRATGTYKFLMYKYDLSKEDAIKMMNERALERGKEIKKGLEKSFNENEKFFKERSHQTKEYWVKKGYNEKESESKVEKVLENIHKKTWEKRRKHPELYYDVNTTQIKYWLKKGYNEKESKEKIKVRQKTFTLEKCIKKYGEKKGLFIFNERQRKWSEKMEKKYKNGEYLKFRKEMYSEPEIELFEYVIDNLQINKSDIYYGDNQFFRYFKDLGKTFSYDFVYNKKIIEFNGDYWHCNPKFYNKNYFHKYLQLFAYEIWKKEKIKINSIKKLGYDILVIWENDYKQNKEKIIQECIEFLKND